MNKFLLRRIGLFYLLLALLVYFYGRSDWFSGAFILAALSLVVFRLEVGEWARTKYPAYYMMGNSLYDALEARSDKVDENVSKWLNKPKPPLNPN